MATPPFANFANQVLPNPGVLPYVQQQNFGMMVGEVSDANPDMDPETIKVRLNGIVRKIYDRRTWSGMMIRGQIATTGFIIGGSVNITQGSNQVVGVGTNWPASVAGSNGSPGMQFRLGFNTPRYTIIQLDNFSQAPNQVITLDMPWAGVSYTGAGYFIAQYYYTMGPNIRYIHTATNLIMAWRMQLGFNQQTLDTVDPWRINTFSPAALVQMPRDQNGSYQVELWPVPSIVQALPFIAVVQPPNLIYDSDSLPAAIRTDIVTKLGRADALVYRGPKLNKYYDAAESQRLRGEAEAEIQWCARADEDLYRQDILMPVESMDYAPNPFELTASFSINHGVAARWAQAWQVTEGGLSPLSVDQRLKLHVPLSIQNLMPRALRKRWLGLAVLPHTGSRLDHPPG